MIPRLAYIFTATGVPASMVMSSSAMIGSSLPSSRITVPIFSPALMSCGIKLVKIPSDTFRISMYSGFALGSASILPLNRSCTPLFFKNSLTIALPSYGWLFSSSRTTGRCHSLECKSNILRTFVGLGCTEQIF